MTDVLTMIRGASTIRVSWLYYKVALNACNGLMFQSSTYFLMAVRLLPRTSAAILPARTRSCGAILLITTTSADMVTAEHLNVVCINIYFVIVNYSMLLCVDVTSEDQNICFAYLNTSCCYRSITLIVKVVPNLPRARDFNCK